MRPAFDLSILQKTYDLTLWYVPILNKWPRDHKFLLCCPTASVSAPPIWHAPGVALPPCSGTTGRDAWAWRNSRNGCRPGVPMRPMVIHGG